MRTEAGLSLGTPSRAEALGSWARAMEVMLTRALGPALMDPDKDFWAPEPSEKAFPCYDTGSVMLRHGNPRKSVQIHGPGL